MCCRSGGSTLLRTAGRALADLCDSLKGVEMVTRLLGGAKRHSRRGRRKVAFVVPGFVSSCARASVFRGMLFITIRPCIA